MPKPGIAGHIQRRRAHGQRVDRSFFRQALDRIHGREGDKRPPDHDICAALARLSRTEDGQIVLQWVHDQTFGHVPPSDAPEGALREATALNRFATKFFNLLDRGLARENST